MKEKIEQFLNTVNSIKDTANSLGWLVSYPEDEHVSFFAEARFQIENIQVDFVYSTLSIKSIKLTLMYLVLTLKKQINNIEQIMTCKH